MANPQRNESLSALDQIMPRVYSRLILSFPLATSDSSKTASLLQQAFERTVDDIPILAFNVVASSDRPGRFELQSSASMSAAKFAVKELKAQTSGWKLPYSDLKGASFPLSELDDQILAPVGMLPTSTPAPSCAAQLNVLEGGLLLCIAFHHSVMDGTAYSTVFKVLASHCQALQNEHGPKSSTFTLQDGSFDRQPLLNIEKDSRAKLPPAYANRPPAPPSATTDAPIPAMPPMSTAIFTLDNFALASLKHDIAEEISGHGEGEAWTSTNDVIGAVLWHAITTARSTGSPIESSRLGMAVNGRGRLHPPLPDTYLGNVNIYASSVVDGDTLTSTSVADMAKTAVAIRQSISQIDDAFIRNLISAVDALEDPSTVIPAFNSFLGNDLAITSWLDMGIEDFEWGALGKVDAVRIPRAAFDGLCIILPRTADDGIEVLVGLKTEHMEKLKADEHFNRFVSFSDDER